MDLEIPPLRTIFYLFNWVEAGPKVPPSGFKHQIHAGGGSDAPAPPLSVRSRLETQSGGEFGWGGTSVTR